MRTSRGSPRRGRRMRARTRSLTGVDAGWAVSGAWFGVFTVRETTFLSTLLGQQSSRPRCPEQERTRLGPPKHPPRPHSPGMRSGRVSVAGGLSLVGQGRSDGTRSDGVEHGHHACLEVVGKLETEGSYVEVEGDVLVEDEQL